MNYKDTTDWMFAQLPMYQNQGKSAYKKDLTNTIKLVDHLKNPHLKFKSVHVAGTNGKGSTSHMIASVLQEAGYKVGLYTSPHLKDFRERIKINGKEISKNFVISFIKRNRSFFELNSLSFFEMTVGMAFDYFSKKKVDIAVVEVGLGGRLDSTNVLIPEVSVITNIGFDHMQFLGDTLEKIATEKAGIIKDNIPVIIGETQKETKVVFEKIASQKKSSIVFADTFKTNDFKSDLLGSYQKKNLKTAASALNSLKSQGWKISDKNFSDGFMFVKSNTGLKGRWQILQLNPKVICDIGHNKEGLTEVINQLKKEKYKNLHIVIGFVVEKDVESLIELFPKKAKYYYCKPQVIRGLDADILKSQFDSKGYEGIPVENPKKAYKLAIKNAHSDDVIFIGGSTFVVSDIL